MIGFNNTFFANIKKKSKFYSKNIIFFLHIALLALRWAVGCATFGAFIHFKSEKQV